MSPDAMARTFSNNVRTETRQESFTSTLRVSAFRDVLSQLHFQPIVDVLYFLSITARSSQQTSAK